MVIKPSDSLLGLGNPSVFQGLAAPEATLVTKLGSILTDRDGPVAVCQRPAAPALASKSVVPLPTRKSEFGNWMFDIGLVLCVPVAFIVTLAVLNSGLLILPVIVGGLIILVSAPEGCAILANERRVAIAQKIEPHTLSDFIKGVGYMGAGVLAPPVVGIVGSAVLAVFWPFILADSGNEKKVNAAIASAVGRFERKHSKKRLEQQLQLEHQQDQQRLLQDTLQVEPSAPPFVA